MFIKRILAIAVLLAVTVTTAAGCAPTVTVEPNKNITLLDESEYKLSSSTLTVDMSAETGDILHGASGFLYGISNEDVPTVNTLVPLKPKVLATKGALGTEHPYGDALDVAETFLAGGGEQVMMYNSNYYGVFGVTADYKDYSAVLETIIAPHVYQWKQEWKQEHGTPNKPKDELGKVDIDKAIIYIPINEGTPVNGAESFAHAFESYYKAIKAGDPDAVIAGPNDAGYGSQEMRKFLQHCANNDCMPDVITWHELGRNCLSDMSRHMEDFREIWSTLNWSKNPFANKTMPQIIINEYAIPQDCGVGGALVNWIARLEDEKIYGCLPFWQEANNLNGLTSDANEGASAWWAYKWYGDMSGKTLKVYSSTTYDRLYGVATIDKDKQIASVLMGGEDGRQTLMLKNISDSSVFKDEKFVHITVEKAPFNGYAGTVSETPVILDGIFEVINGDVEVIIGNTKYADAFYVTVTKTDETEAKNPLVAPYYMTYEAEKAVHRGLRITNPKDYAPNFYFSDGFALEMKEKGNLLTYEIEVPIDGRYQLNFLYGNGTGCNRNDMDNHAPKNVSQAFSIDGGEFEEDILQSSLYIAITDCYTKYVDLKAGKHTVAVKSVENAEILHDALNVMYVGAYGEELPLWSNVYEAEKADFNTLSDNSKSQVITETDISGYSGNGYVTGLHKTPMTEGGGIRWNVVVEESGLYDFTLRYQASKKGDANIYVGNSVTTLDSLVKSVELESGKEWKTVTATVYLQKGINIVDLDTDVEAYLDYLKIQSIPEEALGEYKPVVIEAEDCIPIGSAIQIAKSEGASDGTYVIGFEGDKNAENDKDKYLEFTYDAPKAGSYELRVFQSNDDICGTHTYNIKIIDKYSTIQVKNEKGEVIDEGRYFFINTSSNDTFKEKTIRLTLEKGKNTVKVFNDDSWQVLWGGTQGTPGENELDNYSPNFDKFVITPTALDAPIVIEEDYRVTASATAGGYVYADKNEAADGDSATVYMLPVRGIDRVLVNGEDVTSQLSEDSGVYSIKAENITENIDVSVYFEEGNGEYLDKYIKNAGFSSRDLNGWTASSDTTAVKRDKNNSFDGYGVEILEGTLTQTVTGIPKGDYLLGVYCKAEKGAVASGKVTVSACGQQDYIVTSKQYEQTLLRVYVDSDGTLDIKVEILEDTGALYLDSFSLTPAPERDMSQVDELLAYFVDCGDHDPKTLSDGDLFGYNNSVTDRVYGIDVETGYAWGVVTDETDYRVNMEKDGAVYTVHQWADDSNNKDGLPKTESFRYARDQLESDISPRYIKYRFELDRGVYDVAVCMSNTWTNATYPDLYLNGTEFTENGYIIPSDEPAVAYGIVDLSDAEVNDRGRVVLDVYALSDDPTIQMNYITIAYHKEFADTDKLGELYAECSALQDEGYIPATWTAFTDALSIAQKLLNEGNISYKRQSEVTAARTALDKAYNALVKVSDVQDSNVYYFVDCGDHTPATLSGDDKFGIYNSLTDMIYSPDPVSGKYWGLVEGDNDKLTVTNNGTMSVNTKYQQANGLGEDEDLDGKGKLTTFRFAAGQLEAGISPRYIKYMFELEPGTYEVEVCMGNAWSNSANPDIYLNDIKINTEALAIPGGGSEAVVGTIAISEGESLLVSAISEDDPTINMHYIIIRKPNGDN